MFGIKNIEKRTASASRMTKTLLFCFLALAAYHSRTTPDSRRAATRLLREAPKEAFGLVLCARTNTPAKTYARARLERILEYAPDERELRNLDHYFNAHEAVRPGSWLDYQMAGHIVLAYSALKWVDQRNSHTNFLGWASRGRWSARAPSTSRASWDEVLARWQGAKDGFCGLHAY